MNAIVIATIVITYANGFPATVREEFRAPTAAAAMQACAEYSEAVVDRFSVTLKEGKQPGGAFVCVPKRDAK